MQIVARVDSETVAGGHRVVCPPKSGAWAQCKHDLFPPRAAVGAILSPPTPTIGVYQYEKLLKTFTDQAEAVAYARHWDHANVVLLKDGTWLWDNWLNNELK